MSVCPEDIVQEEIIQQLGIERELHLSLKAVLVANRLNRIAKEFAHPLVKCWLYLSLGYRRREDGQR